MVTDCDHLLEVTICDLKPPASPTQSQRATETLRSQIATASKRNCALPPHAFTEHGEIMAASVLNTPLAIETIT